MKFSVYPRWNVVFYSFAVGGFCLNFANGMPYQPWNPMVDALFKSLFMGMGLGSLVVGFCAMLESFDEEAKQRTEKE